MAERIAVVTGGSRGIGRAVALRLAQDGAKVIITYVRGKEAADEVIETLRAMEEKPLLINLM